MPLSLADVLMDVARRAYLAGFLASGCSYNGERARDDKVDLEKDGQWTSSREADLGSVMSQIYISMMKEKADAITPDRP